MSIPITYLINDAALLIGDPNKTRVTLDEWVLFFNQAARALCEKADVYQLCSKFDLSTERRFAYPTEMTQATRIAVTETPDDEATFKYLKEKFEDEWRAETDGHYPSETVPTHYFAERSGFYLLPRALVAIPEALEITYFGIPDRVTDSTAAYPLPESTQDYVIRRMVIASKLARNRVAEANADFELWNADVEGLQVRIEDPSNDRRSSLQPRRRPYAGMR